MLVAFLIFTLLVISLAFASIVKAQNILYLQGKIARRAFLRNSALDLFGILLATTLAGLLGGHFARIATAPIPAEFPKLVAGLLVGASVGAGVGLLVEQAQGRLRRA
jgi:hypothetical protein